HVSALTHPTSLACDRSFLHLYAAFRALPPFPTRRSSDLGLEPSGVADFRVYVPSSGASDAVAPTQFKVPLAALEPQVVGDILELDRKSTRLNSSHEWISYAVFCLKKKTHSSRPMTVP